MKDAIIFLQSVWAQVPSADGAVTITKGKVSQVKKLLAVLIALAMLLQMPLAAFAWMKAIASVNQGGALG